MATITTIEKLDVSLANNKPLAKTKFGTQELVVDSEGNYEWPVEVMVCDDIGVDTLKISLRAPENPVADVKPATMLRFLNVRLQMGTYNRKQWAKLTAEAVQKPNVKQGQ